MVVYGSSLYDVTDPLRPRLVCTANTEIKLADARTVAYVDEVGGKTRVLWHDIVSGANRQVGLLPHIPQGLTSWTADGKIEIYPGKQKDLSDGFLVPVHLVFNGTDRVLFSIQSVEGGWESRWSPYPILEISPAHTYLAISDSEYGIAKISRLHIFSIVDGRQLLSGPGGNGGTWLADDRFVWPSDVTGSLVQWTPQAGVTAFRADKWALYGITHSPEGQWLAGTVEGSDGEADVLIFPASGGAATRRRLGSAPVFVSPTVVWYGGEKFCAQSDPCGADSTVGDGTVHAYNVITHTDTVIKIPAR